MSLTIHTSNRLERLVEALARVVAPPLSSPFVPEIIVVQSAGMQRWLALQLAARFGVWANCRYPFPNTAVRELFAAVLPDLPDAAPFDPEVMTWRLMGLLPELRDHPACLPLRSYLEGEREELRRFQLATRIADTFDQYTLYRPDLLREWEEGRGDGWQPLLWQRLCAAGGGRHRGGLREEFCRTLAAAGPGEYPLPERLSVFGISSLPPYHLEVLAAAARFTAVHLFLLSPCREYWGDILPARELARLPAPARPYRDEGHPLLASLGRLGRDFSEAVLARGEAGGSDLYEEPGSGSLLHHLQGEILDLRGTAERREIAPGDRSLQLHSCHSPVREIEVLHDTLLDLFERLPGLAPREIVVMTPDIDTYAPAVAMVFDGTGDPARKIPWSVADRSLAGAGEVTAVLLKLLALPGSRLTAAALVDLLESGPVCRSFGIDAAGLALVRGWVAETRVRWGADAAHRACLGLPPYGENSWEAGLDRLFLGYALAGEGSRLFNGILPYDELEGEGAETLGRLADFVAAAGDAARSLATPRTIGRWRETLGGLLARFVAAGDDEAHELAAVAAVVASLERCGAEAGFDGEVGLETVRAWLLARLGREERGGGYLTGGVTFCAMLPMRSIPFRVVALVGMNDGAFPRQARPPGFDLMARFPRPGDRSLRDEDRYLFLECLLSARDALVISYVGQSIRDNSEIPPSVLVSELLDTVERGFSAGEGVRSRLVTRHPLQPFSRQYFTPGSPLASYAGEECAALREAALPWTPAPFLTRPLPAPPDGWREVPLARLVRFFANPARFFLEQRLGIRPEEPAAPLVEREPFTLENLDAYGIREELLELLLRGDDPETLFRAVRSRGILPPGRHGRELWEGAVAGVSSFAERVGAAGGGVPELPPLDLELRIGAFRLTGRLRGLRPERKIAWRPARLKAKDLLRCWLEHLALLAGRRPGDPLESLLVMEDGTAAFGGVAGGEALLGELLDLYWRGLSEPLRFFPEAALAYAGGLAWDLAKARKGWWDPYRERGEKGDPSFRLCFGADDPFTAGFEELARAVMGPLVRNRQ